MKSDFMECSIEGCSLDVYCKGVCKHHYYKAYYAKHRDEQIAYRRAYYIEHADEIKEQGRKRWAEKKLDPDFLEKQRLLYKKHYDSHREQESDRKKKWRREHPEQAHEQYVRYYYSHRNQEAQRKHRYLLNNREKIRAARAKRRFRETQSSNHSYADEIHIYNLANGNCLYCGKWCPFSGEGCGNIDHVVPLSRGGGNDIGNLAWSCEHCNKSKHSKFLIEWLASRR